MAEKEADDAKSMGFKQSKKVYNKYYIRNNNVGPKKYALRRRKHVTVDDFIIGNLIGEGRFGKIYLARMVVDVNLIVALKVVKFTNNNVRNVAREISYLSKLKSKRVIGLYDIFYDRDKVYFVLEYARDGDLYDKIKVEAPFNESDARNMMKSICKAIKKCHDNDIVHSDIKPENILIVGDTLKLADFGLSFKDNQFIDSIGGTIEYSAPELLTGTIITGPYKCIDIWSLGVLFYELVTGIPPFKSFSDDVSIERICTNNYKIPDSLNLETKLFIEYILQPDYKLRPNIKDILSHPWMQ